MLKNDHLRLPTFHFDADPDLAFHFDADPDTAFHLNEDPDPQHCNGNHKGRVIVYGRISLHAENNVPHWKNGAVITVPCNFNAESRPQIFDDVYEGRRVQFK